MSGAPCVNDCQRRRRRARARRVATPSAPAVTEERAVRARTRRRRPRRMRDRCGPPAVPPPEPERAVEPDARDQRAVRADRDRPARRGVAADDRQDRVDRRSPHAGRAVVARGHDASPVRREERRRALRREWPSSAAELREGGAAPDAGGAVDGRRRDRAAVGAEGDADDLVRVCAEERVERARVGAEDAAAVVGARGRERGRAFGDHATSRTSPRCATQLDAAAVPSRLSQIIARSSRPPVATRRPDGREGRREDLAGLVEHDRRAPPVARSGRAARRARCVSSSVPAGLKATPSTENWMRQRATDEPSAASQTRAASPAALARSRRPARTRGLGSPRRGRTRASAPRARVPAQDDAVLPAGSDRPPVRREDRDVQRRAMPQRRDHACPVVSSKTRATPSAPGTSASELSALVATALAPRSRADAPPATRRDRADASAGRRAGRAAPASRSGCRAGRPRARRRRRLRRRVERELQALLRVDARAA